MKWKWAELPAVILLRKHRGQGPQGQVHDALDLREPGKHAAGKAGLKMVPSGAITLMGLEHPSFCGTKTAMGTSSRKIIRVMKANGRTVEPSNGQL